MSEGSVAVLNTKLDILIDDFKSFKQYALGFVMTLAIPCAIYLTNIAMTNRTDIAIIKSELEIRNSQKDKDNKEFIEKYAIKENRLIKKEEYNK